MKYVVYALSVLCLVLGLSTWQYRKMNAANAFALKTQNEAIAAQNVAARELYDRLQEAALREEKLLKERAQAQEEEDGKRKAAIARDDVRGADAPVRVRCEAAPARPSGPSTIGGITASTGTGFGNPKPSAWLLPQENSRRLGEVISEVETLSAAYASCRRALLKE